MHIHIASQQYPAPRPPLNVGKEACSYNRVRDALSWCKRIHFKRVHKRDLIVEDSWTLNGKKRDGNYIILYRQQQEDGSLVNLHLDWE